ncbi:MAG: glycosyltransferase family 2 protein [Bacteroidales bacterium]|nr:glycosyltransferase family 2 protein [Bacteroidales bacterium]
MTTAPISIVIPVFNRAHLIGRTLDSIVAQTIPPERVIIVDNNSTDDLTAVIDDYKRRQLPFELDLLTEEKQGASAARNRGLRAVSTPYLLFFDSDDVMRSDHIETVWSAFTREPDADLVCFRRLVRLPSGGERLSHLPGADAVSTHLIHSCFATQAVAMSLDLARRSGLWDESLTGWDDLEYGLRLALNSLHMVVRDKVLVDVYYTEGSLTGDNYMEKRGVWENALDCVESDLMRSAHRWKDQWLRWVIYRRVILAAHYAREANPASSDAGRFPEESVRSLPPLHRAVLRTVYAWTRRGLRGAHLFYAAINR